MKELKENFDNKIKDHVTIPLSHDNKVDENTGYIRQVRIGEDEAGRAVLEAGFDFTEPDIKEKVERGTIANTSAGVLFDYIHKESGKKFNAVLDHAALTNSPWLNGMKPFGITASENLQVVAFSEENIPNNNGGERMPEAKTTEEKTEVTPSAADKLLERLGLSEDEVASRLEEYESLKAADKKHNVDAQIEKWQEKGVTPAVLSEAKAILMADEGAVVLNLSEEGATKPVTATQLVERLIDSIPVVKLTDEPGPGEKGASEEKPDDEETEEYADLSLAEKTEAANLVLYERMTDAEAVAQVRAKREKK
jgi:phage I-like protein